MQIHCLSVQISMHGIQCSRCFTSCYGLFPVLWLLGIWVDVPYKWQGFCLDFVVLIIDEHGLQMCLALFLIASNYEQFQVSDIYSGFDVVLHILVIRCLSCFSVSCIHSLFYLSPFLLLSLSLSLCLSHYCGSKGTLHQSLYWLCRGPWTFQMLSKRMFRNLNFFL